MLAGHEECAGEAGLVLPAQYPLIKEYTLNHIGESFWDPQYDLRCISQLRGIGLSG